MGGRLWLQSGASLRRTDEGVRPYVIFNGPPQWERSFAPPDGRGRPSLRDFLWSSTVERSFAPLDGRGRPSLRDFLWSSTVERSFAPPDGRGRPSLRDFWWSSTVGRSFAPLDGRGRPSLRDFWLASTVGAELCSARRTRAPGSTLFSVGLHCGCGASLRRTDEGVRPYVIRKLV